MRTRRMLALLALATAGLCAAPGAWAVSAAPSERVVATATSADAGGARPDLRPLFRRPNMRCGLRLDTFEPANPVLLCWRPRDGLGLTIAHDDAGQGGAAGQNAQTRGWKPDGYPLLPSGQTFRFRCRSVTSSFAEQCGGRQGKAVFRCAARPGSLRCTNRAGRGFTVGPSSYDTF